MPNKQEVIEHLKRDLSTLHDDWEQLIQQERMVHDPVFLKKVASDIQQLDQDAKEAARITELKERAQLIHFTLTTPWGAPFVGETTLLEAANTYSDNNPNSSLQHLLTDFSHYSDEKHTPLLNVYNEILEEL